MITKIILVAILICSIIFPFGAFLFSKKKKGGFKAALACNLFFFFGTLVIADILLFGGQVQAAGETAPVAVEGWRYLAAALSTGLSCIGAGIAVASAGSFKNSAHSSKPLLVVMMIEVRSCSSETS